MNIGLRKETTISQQNIIQPVKIFSLGFLRSYVITMRPYLLFVSGITGIAGLSFVTNLPILPMIILSVIFFLSYGFGQALTDCFQTDTDRLSSPYRPLSQGKVRRRDILIVTLTGLLLSGTILTLFSPINLILSLIAIMGLATYTYFKRRWWGGPFYNAWIVALSCLIAYIAGSGVMDSKLLLSPELLSTLAAVLFGYANFVLTGYYKDISADRATGYNTLPVVFGLKISALVSDIFASLTLIACGTAVFLSLSEVNIINWYSIILFGMGFGASLLAQVNLHKVRSESESHRAIVPVVHAYLLLLSAIAVAQKPFWVIPITIFYFGFVLMMMIRPMKQQI